jgi:hypothetical protein
VHVIWHQVPFDYPAFSLRRKLPKHLTQMRSQLRIPHLAPAFRHEDDVVFAVPRRMA